MFGGHGLYQDETFFGIVHKGKLFFKIDESTVGEYRKRKMKPFRPNAKQTLKSYYQVPVEIIEDADALAGVGGASGDVSNREEVDPAYKTVSSPHGLGKPPSFHVVSPTVKFGGLTGYPYAPNIRQY